MIKKITQNIEEWRDVKDPFFSKYYQISNLGRLKSKGRYVVRGGENNRYEYWKMERIMKPRRSKSFPHLFATMILMEDGVKKVKTIYIHKGVAEAFLSRPSSKHVHVEHINGDYANNRTSNLRWITASELSIKLFELYPENKNNLKESNIKSGFYDKLRSEAWKKPFTISQLRKAGLGLEQISKMFDCSPATISNVLNKNNTKETKLPNSINKNDIY
jgi:hypothetical protein